MIVQARQGTIRDNVYQSADYADETDLDPLSNLRNLRMTITDRKPMEVQAVAERDYFQWTDELFSMSKVFDKPEALQGVRVLELCTRVFGPVTGDLLADFGAEVIKIELPGVGDLMRYVAPRGFFWQNVSPAFTHMNHNKYHVGIDIRKPEGVELLGRLVAKSDVLVENFRPGTMDRWGVGYRQIQELNPGLIYAALSTYGQFGSRAATGRPGSEITNQAYSGLAFINGEPERNGPQEHAVPTKTGSWYGWYAEGLFAAYGILLALNHREDSGKGQLVAVSGAECIMKFIDYNLAWYHMDGKVKERLGSYDPSVFPYTFVECKDGYTFLAAYNEEAFQTLMEIIERPELVEDPRFSSFMSRTTLENEEALQEILEQWTRRYPVDEVIQRVQDAISRKKGRAAAVVTGKVTRPGDTLKEQNWWDRGSFRTFQDPVYGELTLQGPLWKMSETPPRLKWLCRPVGADNEDIYSRRLGIGKTELSRLQQDGIA